MAENGLCMTALAGCAVYIASIRTWLERRYDLVYHHGLVMNHLAPSKSNAACYTVNVLPAMA